MQWLRDAHAARGLPPPDIVSQRPQMRADSKFYWQAFTDLISCMNDRGIIPWTAYNDYAERYGEQPERLKRIVGELCGRLSNRH